MSAAFPRFRTFGLFLLVGLSALNQRALTADPVAVLLVKIKENEALYQNLELTLTGESELANPPDPGFEDEIGHSTKYASHFIWQNGKYAKDEKYEFKSFREKVSVQFTKSVWDGVKTKSYSDFMNRQSGSITDSKPRECDFSPIICNLGIQTIQLKTILEQPSTMTQTVVMKDGGTATIQDQPVQILHIDNLKNETNLLIDRYAVYIATERNCLPIRVEKFEGNNPIPYSISEQSHFKEVAPGIWFPRQFNNSYFNKEEGSDKYTLYCKNAFSVTKVELIPKDEKSRIPELVFPEGTNVTERKNRVVVKKYTVEKRAESKTP